MFGENPFYDALDTVRGELHPPHLEVDKSFFISWPKKLTNVGSYARFSGWT
jgi:hypothetical protein